MGGIVGKTSVCFTTFSQMTFRPNVKFLRVNILNWGRSSINLSSNICEVKFCLFEIKCTTNNFGFHVTNILPNRW